MPHSLPLDCHRKTPMNTGHRKTLMNTEMRLVAGPSLKTFLYRCSSVLICGFGQSDAAEDFIETAFLRANFFNFPTIGSFKHVAD